MTTTKNNGVVNINQPVSVPTIPLEAKFGASTVTLEIRERIAPFDMMRNQALIGKLAGKKSTLVLEHALEAMDQGKNIVDAFGPLSQALISMAAVRWNLADDNGPLALSLDNLRTFAEKSPETVYDWLFAFIHKLPSLLSKEMIAAGSKSGTGALRGVNRRRTGKHAKGTPRR